MADLNIHLEMPRLSLRRPGKRAALVFFGILMIAVLSNAGIFIYEQGAIKPPHGLYNISEYTVYYPRHLKDGYKIVPDSLTIDEKSENTINFYVSNQKYKILISETKKPDISFGTLYKERLKDAQTLKLPIGELTTGQFKVNDNRHGSSLVSENTWITMFAPPEVSYSNIVSLNKALRVIKK